MSTRIETQEYVQPEMVEASFGYWFNSNEHIRTPFPEYTHAELRRITLNKFLDWTDSLTEAAKKEINDEILIERFEEMLFETALPLLKTEDEKITVQYPFMIRLDDLVEVKNTDNPSGSRSKVIKRSLNKKGDELFLEVTMQRLDNGHQWQTKFDIPA